MEERTLNEEDLWLLSELLALWRPWRINLNARTFGHQWARCANCNLGRQFASEGATILVLVAVVIVVIEYCCLLLLLFVVGCCCFLFVVVAVAAVVF